MNLRNVTDRVKFIHAIHAKFDRFGYFIVDIENGGCITHSCSCSRQEQEQQELNGAIN